MSLYCIVKGYEKTAGNVRLTTESSGVLHLPRFSSFSNVIIVNLHNAKSDSRSNSSYKPSSSTKSGSCMGEKIRTEMKKMHLLSIKHQTLYDKHQTSILIIVCRRVSQNHQKHTFYIETKLANQEKMRSSEKSLSSTQNISDFRLFINYTYSNTSRSLRNTNYKEVLFSSTGKEKIVQT